MSNSTPQNNEADKSKSQELIPAYRDTVAHFLFGTPGHEPLLIYFLNAFLESDGQAFAKSVEMINPFNPATCRRLWVRGLTFSFIPI